MRFRLLAVDLDGTLVDSAPDLNHCLGLALEAVELPRPTEAETRSWIGDGVEELIRRALANASPKRAPGLFAAAFASFTACYEHNLFRRSRLYPGVVETLDALAAGGVRLACVTNKRAAFTNGVLEQAGIRGKFELVLGGDSLAEKKPSPMQLTAAAAITGIPATAAAMVGDSHHDYRAARAAGYAFVWATYGYCGAIDADPAVPVPSLERFSDLPSLLENL